MSSSDAAARMTGATVVRGGAWTATSHVVPQLYVLALSNTASYALAANGLTITLDDGGTLGYESTP